MKKIVILTGPTGVGKTKLSLDVAKYFNTDIINGDAFSVYKKMDILTAKPSLEEQQIVKHHLIDILDPTEEFSVGDYQKIVRTKIEELSDENKLPFIVGGSGLYVDSIYKDYDFSSPKRSDEIELKYSGLSNDELFEVLISINPVYKDILEINNRKRVLRAIERELSGKSYTDTLSNDYIYDALVIFLTKDREILYTNINNRVEEMFKEGLLEEVKTLYDSGNYSKTSRQAIGFKEFIPYFENVESLDTVKENIKKNSRHLAKRQFTWFNQNPKVVKLENNSETYHKVIELIQNHLLQK